MRCVTLYLTEAGTDTGYFSLYSDADSYTTPFETGVSKADLVAGYYSDQVPDGTNTVRIISNTICTNYVDAVIYPSPTPSISVTPTPTPSITPSITPTPTPSAQVATNIAFTQWYDPSGLFGPPCTVEGLGWEFQITNGDDFSIGYKYFLPTVQALGYEYECIDKYTITYEPGMPDLTGYPGSCP